MHACEVALVVSDSLWLWTVAHQTPLSKGFSRQKYWSGLPCPPLVDPPNLGLEPTSVSFIGRRVLLALVPPGKHCFHRVCVLSSPQSCPTLGNQVGYSPPGSSVQGKSQARILEKVFYCSPTCSPPGALSDPGTESVSLMSPELAGRFFTTSAIWEGPFHLSPPKFILHSGCFLKLKSNHTLPFKICKSVIFFRINHLPNVTRDFLIKPLVNLSVFPSHIPNALNEQCYLQFPKCAFACTVFLLPG